MIHVTITAFIIGAVLDLILGDPRWFPHPIRGFGLLISALERLLRKLPYERAGGCILVCGVLVIVITAVALSLKFGGVIAVAYWIFTSLAVRSLDQESHKVIEALRRGDLDHARLLVGRLVGRDTNHLSEADIVRAVFETVSENMSDAIIAPLFYLVILGVPGMVAYKAVNTMDSMVGYKNDRYIRFGWAAARLDDLANYIPARLTAGLIVLGAEISRLRWRSAIHIILRDARLQPSPNAGYPEAALAGALGVRLGGVNHYFGRPVQKPFLGDPVEHLEANRFSQVRVLLYLVTAISYTLVGVWLW
jgi:adenosylcobinamide-phosphate synthase